MWTDVDNLTQLLYCLHNIALLSPYYSRSFSPSSGPYSCLSRTDTFGPYFPDSIYLLVFLKVSLFLISPVVNLSLFQVSLLFHCLVLVSLFTSFSETLQLRSLLSLSSTLLHQWSSFVIVIWLGRGHTNPLRWFLLHKSVFGAFNYLFTLSTALRRCHLHLEVLILLIRLGLEPLLTLPPSSLTSLYSLKSFPTSSLLAPPFS